MSYAAKSWCFLGAVMTPTLKGLPRAFPRTRSGGRPTHHSVLASAFAVALVSLAGACGSGNGDASPYPTSGTTSPGPSVSPSGSELAAHLARCEEGINSWKESAGQIDYPRTLKVTLGQPTTYNAAIDISDAPMPADQVITVPSGDATSEPITVKCGVAARLIPIGDITVTPAQDSWITREFSPSGVAEWTWTVRTDTTSNKELQLVLMPAHLGDGVPLASGGITAEVFTQVEVTSTGIDRLSDWFANQWVKLAAMVVTLAGAFAAAVKWLGLPWPPTKWFRAKGDASPPATAPDGRTTDKTPTGSG
jgi:hypothetical protein